MLIGLAEAPLVEGPEQFPGELRPLTLTTPQSTITVYPPELKAAPRAPAPGSSLLDAILPKKVGKDGKITIWGLPPAVAYAIVAVIVAGGGLMAYQRFTRGGRRVANSPRRRGGKRDKSGRYKR